MERSFGNYFSRIRLQIGTDCSLATIDVLQESKFQARNLRDVMKAGSTELLEIAETFHDTADIYEMKVYNLFAKIGTLQCNSKLELSQLFTNYP
jgi:hypothetical protein